MCFKLPFLRWRKTTLLFHFLSHTLLPWLALYLPLSLSLSLSLSLGICVDDHMAKFFGGEISETCSYTHTHTRARVHTHTPPQSFVYERPWWWNLFSDGSILKHMNGNISMILLPIFLSLCISICGYTQTHTHTHAHTLIHHLHTKNLLTHLVQPHSLFPESIYSGCCTSMKRHQRCCQSLFFKNHNYYHRHCVLNTFLSSGFSGWE